ncbi:hypothetical protein [Mangrovicoccus algicola]|nr:hypothetical protein [Mangrovicoccus algicola]
MKLTVLAFLSATLLAGTGLPASAQQCPSTHTPCGNVCCPR